MNTDLITTILGLLLAALGAGNEALNAFQGKPVNWVVVAGAALVAAIGYWTNKTSKKPQ